MTTASKSALLISLAQIDEADPRLADIAALLNGQPHDPPDELLSSRQSCSLLGVSRATLYRNFAPKMWVGRLPRWSRRVLLQGSRRGPE